ncbi:MAG TPA: hypothetical protein VII99_00700, partial [Bacteroidia bacterium]
YTKMLELDRRMMKKDFSGARSACNELLNIVRENHSVRRRQRIGVVYDQLSRCELYLSHSKRNSNAEEAANHLQYALSGAREAQHHFKLNSENYCIALEQEFHALFSMGEFDNCIPVVDRMLSSASRKELGEFRYAKYNLLLANVLFKLKRFDVANNILSEERQIAQDKYGWEIGARILRIMTLVESNRTDEASIEVRRLKDFFIYNGKANSISKRDKKILNLLLLMERKGFDFSLLVPYLASTKYVKVNKIGNYLAELGSVEDGLKWEPFTSEVIPFQEWVLGEMPAGARNRHLQEKPFSAQQLRA